MKTFVKPLVVIAVLVLALLSLLVIGCCFENWRAKRDWEICKTGLEAKGEHLDMDYFIPPPVPDGKNFALTPLLKPLLDYTKDPDTGGLVLRDPDSPLTKIIAKVPDTEATYPPATGWMTGKARQLEAWQAYYRKSLPGLGLSKSPPEDILTVFGKFDGMFADLRQEMETHPMCRYPLHYELVFGMPLPHLTTLQNMTTVLSLRASVELQMNRPDDALADLQFGFRLVGTVRDEPMIIDGLVRIAMTSALLQAVWEGIASHRWNEEQLAVLEKELQGWNFLSDFNRGMRIERGSANWLCEKARNDPKLLGKALELQSFSDIDISTPNFFGPLLRASLYRNQILINTMIQEKFLSIMDEKGQAVNVTRAKDARISVENLHASPYTFVAKIMLPAYTYADMKFAEAQTYVNEAAIACEIERYRLAHGALPATLEALQMPGLPHDVINGLPLHYRVEGGDNYVLYSVGWNETDDGGKVVMRRDDSHKIDYEQGDWVWSFKPL